MLELYVEAVRVLAKATGDTVSPKSIKAFEATRNSYEPKLVKSLMGIFKRAATRFKRKLSVDRLADLLSKIKKDSQDDVKQAIADIIDAAFVGSAEDFVGVESDLVDDLAQQYHTVYAVKLNFKQVNTQAVNYLQNHAENHFSRLSDDVAEGILRTAGTAMADTEGYTIKDIARSIRDAIFTNNIPLPNQSLETTAYSMLVARTESARASSQAQKATLESLGLKTWQWQASDYACDECSENDGEICAIGDSFPSGDDSVPAHPNCLCCLTAVLDELTSLDSDDDTDSADDEEAGDD